MLKRLLWSLRKENKNRKKYFRQAHEEITQKNLKMLQSLSITVIVLLLAFYIVTPLVIHGWRVTPQHFLIFPIAVLFALLVRWRGRRKAAGSADVVWLCVIFEIILYAFAIVIDVFTYPDSPSAFMPILLAMLPAIFILPLRVIYLIAAFFEAAYIVAVIAVKSPGLIDGEIFNSMVGFAFSFPFAQLTMRLRVQDFTVQRKYFRLSQQDTLVGIFNKASCTEMICQYLEDTAPASSCTMLLFDLDDFKAVNDWLGHYTGDVLLKTFSGILQSTFRASDIVGRFGGDEFAVLLQNCTDMALLREKCKVVQDRLYKESGENCHKNVTCSIGGVVVTNCGAEFEDLFQQTDAALYEAKSFLSNRCILRNYYD